MLIHILSDVHAEFEPFVPPATDGEVVVLAGDIHLGGKGLQWVREHFPEKPVIYVLGNHEYYREAIPKLTHQLLREAKGSNVYLLENDRVTIDGVHFLGCTLWTDFRLFGNPKIAGFEAARRMTDYRKIRVSPQYRALRPVDTAGIHMKSVAWLKGELDFRRNEKTVVVTHHAPSLRSVPGMFKTDILSAAYASHLDEVIGRSRASVWIHGHVHSRVDYKLGKTRVVCNPKGYPDEPNEHFNPELIVEV